MKFTPSSEIFMGFRSKIQPSVEIPSVWSSDILNIMEHILLLVAIGAVLVKSWPEGALPRYHSRRQSRFVGQALRGILHLCTCSLSVYLFWHCPPSVQDKNSSEFQASTGHTPQALGVTHKPTPAGSPTVWDWARRRQCCCRPSACTQNSCGYNQTQLNDFVNNTMQILLVMALP